MEQSSLPLVILFSLFGGVFSLVGAIAMLRAPQNVLQKFTRLAVPFAAGALLSAVFLDLLPEGLDDAEPRTVLLAALGGIVGFFILERFTQWFHHHHDHENDRSKSSLLIIVADTLHNALDGVAIASGFLVSIPVGIVTTIAVAAHEIPQEIGDFGVLLNKGMAKRKVIFVNIISALSTVLLAILTFVLGGEDKVPVGLLLGISSGFLLYVALSDLIPTIHEKRSKKGTVDIDVVVLIGGIAVVALAIKLAEQYIAH